MSDIAAVQFEIAEAQRHLFEAQAMLSGETPTPTPPGVMTDRDPRPLPDLPAIAVGQVITDPTFGGQLARLTGPETDADTVLSYRSADSSVQRSWNSTSTRFLIEDTWSRQHVYDFDAPTLTARHRRILPFAVRRRKTVEELSLQGHLVLSMNGGDASWDDVNPDLVYGRHGNKVIKVYDVVKGTDAVVVDCDQLGLNLPVESYTGGVTVMNGTLLTVCGGASQDYNHHVVLVTLATGAVRTLDTLTLTQFNEGQGFYLHSSILDLTAEYLMLQPSNLSNDQGHLYVVDLKTNHIVQVSTGTSGHLAVGRQVWVNQDCAPDTAWDAAQWCKRTFQAPNTVANCIDPVLEPKEVYLAEHPSWTSMKTYDTPFVTATYRYQPSDVPWRAWDEELLTINAMTGEVRRQAHHRSLVMMANGAWDYWATPRPNISCDGRFALFTSNWGRTLGTDGVEGGDRQDCFVVALR